MIRKESLYTVAQLGWALLVGAMFVFLYSGQAEPIVRASTLPRPLWIPGVVAVGLIVAGWMFIQFLKGRSWRAMGRQAGLSPVESTTGLLGPLGTPDLTGTFHGRPVRVHSVARSGVTSGDGTGLANSGDVTTTVIEAELHELADSGVVLGRLGSGDVGADRTDIGEVWIPNEAFDDRFVTVEGCGELAGDVLGPEVREALLEVDTLETLLIGDAVGSTKHAVEKLAEERSWGNLAVDAFDDVLYDNPATVANQFQGMLLAVDELERNLEAVVAVADAFEDVQSAAVPKRTMEGGRP